MAWTRPALPLSLTLGVLTFLHVFSAICYLGSVITFGLVIGPQLLKIAPSSANEFLAKVGPRFVRFSEGFAGLTILFGVILLGATIEGDFSRLSLSTAWGLSMSAGISTALLAFIVGIAIVTPATKRLIGYAQGQLANPGPPPPEMMKTAARLTKSSMVGMALLIITVVFMVAAASA